MSLYLAGAYSFMGAISFSPGARKTTMQRKLEMLPTRMEFGSSSKIKRFSRAQNSKVSLGLEGVLHVDINSSFGLFPVVRYTLGKYDML